MGDNRLSSFGEKTDSLTIYPFCKNIDTQRVIDVIYLKYCKEIYKNTLFRAYSCNCCHGEWHFALSKEDRRKIDNKYRTKQNQIMHEISTK